MHSVFAICDLRFDFFDGSQLSICQSLPSSRLSDPQTLRLSDPQTLRLSDPQTLRLSDPQTLRLSDQLPEPAIRKIHQVDPVRGSCKRCIKPSQVINSGFLPVEHSLINENPLPLPPL